jgi:hypothetical protein
MKAKTLKAFIDRETGAGYNVGDIYESGDSGRLDELVAGGYIEAIAPRSKKPPATAAAPADKSTTVKAKE